MNDDILADATVILHQYVLLTNIARGIGVNPAPLQRFLVASDDYEVHKRSEWDLNVQVLKASQIHYICKVLLHSDLFGHYKPLRRLMTVLIGEAGTSKAQKVMQLISGTYCKIPDGYGSALSKETLIPRWMDDNIRGRRNPNKNLANTVWLAQLPKILLAAPTKNMIYVLEEPLQESVSVFNESGNRWVKIVLIYRRLGTEQHTPICTGLRATRDKMIPQTYQQQIHGGITLCILGSINLAYPFRHASRNWTAIIPYQYVMVEEAPQVSDADLFPLFNII